MMLRVREMLGDRALGLAWLLGPSTWLLALRGGDCGGNSGFIFINTNKKMSLGEGWISAVELEVITMFLHLVTSVSPPGSLPNTIQSMH